MVAAPIDLWPATSIDPNANLLAPANETSTDTQYLRHQFVTWQGWLDWKTGWTPPEAREAITAHLHGWPYQSASLRRHLPRFAYILGALNQRTAPPLRTQWHHESSKGPRWVIDELDDLWARQWRPDYETKLGDMAILGASIVHVHWAPDVEAGIERPVLKRWPHESIFFRAASPAFPGGWWAITSDSGLVRIVPGDGHWIMLAHGERWHENAAILALGETFVAGKLSERDEAGLSEAAGRASPYATLPEGVPVGGPVDPTNPTATEQARIGQSVQAMVAGFGRARTGAVVPFGTKIDKVEIASDTQFFDRYSMRQIVKCALAILGKPGSMQPGAKDVYTPIIGYSVDEALTDKDHEATVRGWDEGIVRPFRDINAINTDAHIVGERYADANAKAEAVAKRAQLHADTIASMRKAGLDPKQEDADALADQMSTAHVPLAKFNLDANALNAALRGGEARAAYGLQPFGDERDDETLAHLLKAGPTGAMPVPGETSTPQAPVPVPGPNDAAPPGESAPPAPAPATDASDQAKSPVNE